MPGSKAFGAYFLQQLERSQLGQSEFARRVKRAPGVVQYIREGRRSLAPDAVELWADVLGLKGDDRDRFRFLAAVSHLPEPMQATFVRLLDEHQRLRGLERAIEEARRKR